MPDEILDGQQTPSTPAVPAGGKRVKCDFCKCDLAPSGDVIKMSTEAKGMRDSTDTIEKLQTQLEHSAQELTAARAEITRLQNSPATVTPPGSGSRSHRPWTKRT